MLHESKTETHFLVCKIYICFSIHIPKLLVLGLFKGHVTYLPYYLLTKAVKVRL